MSVERVQDAVEALGARLHRGVAVDDHALKLLAAGPDFGDADPARVWSLLNRRTRPEDVDYPRLRRLTGPLWVDADESLQLHARLCIPVRHAGELVGFMWIIDRDHTLTELQVADAVATAEELGPVLAERLASQRRDDAHGRELVHRLISADPVERATAADDALASGLVLDDSHVAVVAARREQGGKATGLAAAVREACRNQPPASYLLDVSEHSAVVVLAQRSPVSPSAGEVAGRILDDRRHSDTSRWHVAVSAQGQGLREVARAHRQTAVALRVARRLPEAGRLVRWDDLGVWALLGQWPDLAMTEEVLPASLAALLKAPDTSQLLRTLEVFLDEAGAKKAAAHRLGVHRTTLYARLDRIEAITGLSVSTGSDRLLLHLATKLHRLYGHGLGEPGDSADRTTDIKTSRRRISDGSEATH